MKRIFNLIIAAFIFFAFNSCQTGNDEGNNKTQKVKTDTVKHVVASSKDCNNVHWSHHKGDEGPENWENLCNGFFACGGNSQSPINIVTNDVIKENNLSVINFNYTNSTVDIINNSHTVQFNVSGENSVTVNNKKYKLLQFHYHTSSEHTLDGKYFPAEVHLVNKSADNDYAVIGIFYKEGQENELFTKYMDKFPTKEGEYKSEDKFKLLSLLPENKSYYHYKGSLTTPPCSETVNWYILTTPLTASKEQLTKLSKILNNNFRPIQKLNGRKVEVFSE